jgi:hypothetical protein
MLKEMVGKSADTIDLPDGASVADILNQYGSQIPRLKAVLLIAGIGRESAVCQSWDEAQVR